MNDMTNGVDLGSVLEPAKLPLPARPKVWGIRAEPYVDHLGDHELRVWVILEDSPDLRDWGGEGASEISSAIHQALLSAGERRFPYLRFRTRREYRRERRAG